MFRASIAERFEVVLEERFKSNLISAVSILKDKQTGVQYIFAANINGGGLAPLLDKDGKPSIDDPTV